MISSVARAFKWGFFFAVTYLFLYSSALWAYKAFPPDADESLVSWAAWKGEGVKVLRWPGEKFYIWKFGQNSPINHPPHKVYSYEIGFGAVFAFAVGLLLGFLASLIFPDRFNMVEDPPPLEGRPALSYTAAALALGGTLTGAGLGYAAFVLGSMALKDNFDSRARLWARFGQVVGVLTIIGWIAGFIIHIKTGYM